MVGLRNTFCFYSSLCRYHYYQRWRKNHPEKVRFWGKRYQLNHPGKMKELWHKANVKRYNRLENTDRLKEYRKTPSGIEATRKAVKKYELTHHKRKQAWGRANKIKNRPCSICGKSPSHRHHPDINKPLEIVFLCPLHHKEAHKLSL